MRVDKKAETEVSRPAEELRAHFHVNLFAGGIAGLCTRSLTAPLSTIQITLQTSTLSGAEKLRISGVVQEIYSTTGLRGFWSGNSAGCTRLIFHLGLKFAGFHYLNKDSSEQSGGKERGVAALTSSAAISGAAAGVLATLASHPLDVIKTQMIVMPRNSWPAVGPYRSPDSYSSMLDAARKILASSGIQGLYRGLAVSICGIIPLEAGRFGCYTALTSYFSSARGYGDIGLLSAASCGYVAGVVGHGLAYPFDVVRRRLQADPVSVELDYRGAIDAAKSILREEGFRSFFKGSLLNKVKNPVSSAVRFAVFEAVVSKWKVGAAGGSSTLL